MAQVNAERERRVEMWTELSRLGGPLRVTPETLRNLRIYGGAQGIWVDQQVTRKLGTYGITVGLLHTGSHYADELTSDGVIYHYPDTDRPAGRDKSEIEATKAAGENGLPVFTITRPTPSSTVRDVHLSWVDGWDDNARWFLVIFGDTAPVRRAEPTPDNEPFTPHKKRARHRSTAVARSGQHRFKFDVFQRYGSRCVVCGQDLKELLEAAHVVTVEHGGPDDPRNGLLLCANHHRGFDRELFAVDPETLAICYRPTGPHKEDLRIERDDLTHLERTPHPLALQWRWKRWTE